jgi:hypothetical protein
MPAAPDASQIVLDALGKLHEHGHGMFGVCLDCAGLYRMSVPAEQRISSDFDINLPKLGSKPNKACRRCGCFRPNVRHRPC